MKNFQENMRITLVSQHRVLLFQIPKERFDTDHINKLYFYAEIRTSQPAEPDLQGFCIDYIHCGWGTLKTRVVIGSK